MGLIERCFVWQAAYTPVLHTGESADPNLPSSTGESSSSDRKSAKKKHAEQRLTVLRCNE